MQDQKGQVLLILILVMTVGLTIGLSVIQRSLTGVSTASKLEQSSRALSAAEAGIERALNSGPTGSPTTVNFTENSSGSTTIDSGKIPTPEQALEYPPLTKEDIAQFWLADPNPNLSLPTYYNNNSIIVYWGKPGLPDVDKAALEISIIYLRTDNGSYDKKQFFFDTNGIGRRVENNFKDPLVAGTDYSLGSCGDMTIPNSGSPTRYYCTVTLSGLNSLPGGTSRLIMVRARFLYNSIGQPLALAPASGSSLPPQAQIYTATGTSGETQRKVQLFKLDQVVPPYLDYAIFSAGAIVK